MLLYTQDNKDHFPFSGRSWPQLPMVDLMKLFNPYLSTNGSSFYVCPADQPPPWNFAWTKAYGFGTAFGFPIKTNDLLFGDSYYYYRSFYNDDSENGNLQQRSAEQVRWPANKAIMGCFAEPQNGNIAAHGLAHGNNGFPVLFVDGHSAYTRFSSLIYPPTFTNTDLDVTPGGLTGRDLK
jgi:prepilin-type processing-associated H-X9-DG protein